VPEAHADKLGLDWLDTRWSFEGTSLVRPRGLYSPENHTDLIVALRRCFPDYVSFSDELNRWMIGVPRGLIREAFIPSMQLMLLKRRGTENTLEKNALDLVEILSRRSGVPMGFFGIHGSISLGMHREFSDIDISVYGACNYNLVKKSLIELEGEGSLTISRENAYDARRMNRGLFRRTDFVVNATRRFSEIDQKGESVKPLGEAEVECLCVNAEESVFRPAVYEVSECSEVDGRLPNKRNIYRIVSMNGLFRDIVRPGEKIRARGMVESVTDDRYGRYFRLVVGSGAKGEYLSWTGSGV
jgi:predicted nucleotidyltransferase